MNAGFQVHYSSVDRMVHKLALGQLDLQKSLSRLEDGLLKADLTAIDAADPVFITALPRAGTTLLLEILAEVPALAAHTYRDMPYLLCPMLWDRLSRGFRKSAVARERAHGDGMLVDYDSVEAFEEILWRAFWPDHFEATRIRPWSSDADNTDFADFLRQHMRKIIALARRRCGSRLPVRYVSKNNANIARLSWLQRAFPDCTIVVPFRDPAAHIASLARQHANFTEAHDRDRFILDYMESVGHLEFGEALRPIDFGGWFTNAASPDPTIPEFWADYWCAAYEAVLQQAGRQTVIISYDRLCERPADGLRHLEMATGLEPGSLSAAAERFRPPTVHGQATPIDDHRSARLVDVLERLRTRALF